MCIDGKLLAVFLSVTSQRQVDTSDENKSFARSLWQKPAQG